MLPIGVCEGEITNAHTILTIVFKSILTLKLAGYFAKHIPARGGGFVEPPPKKFETANN